MKRLYFIFTIVFLSSNYFYANDNNPRINHYGSADEIFIYNLYSFVKHNNVQGMEKLIQQMKTLKKEDGTINLDTRTRSYIKGVYDRFKDANNETAIQFMAPFLFASGQSFIDALGWNRHRYEWAKEDNSSVSYIESCRKDMAESQWNVDVALKRKGLITQDIMYVKKGYLKKSFPRLPEDIQTKVLQEAAESYAADCKSNANLSYYGYQACEDFHKKLTIMEIAHKKWKEQEAKRIATETEQA